MKVVRLLGMKIIGFECGPWRWYRGMGDIHINRGSWRGRVGEDRRGKEMDRCPLTFPLQSVVSRRTKNARRLPGPL
jgi:hypothetical protein